MTSIIQEIVQNIQFLRYWIVEYFRWLFDIKFQLKMLHCCISYKDNFDKYNVSSVIAIYGIPIIVAILLYLFGTIIAILIFGFINTNISVLIILVIWAMASFLALSLNDEYCKKSEAHLNGTQNSLFFSDRPHHGIIFAPQETIFRKMFISDSIDLLVSLFDEKIPFKIYPIYCDTDFENVYSNPTVKWLWIIGHGWRGGFYYSQNGGVAEIEYSRYPKNSNLLFIAQLHCNNESGKSLVEINELQPDHDLGHIRFPFQNRCYITIKAKKFLQEYSQA